MKDGMKRFKEPKFNELSKTYDIYSTGEKTYVHHKQYGCVARLCKVSAEFYKVSREYEGLVIVGCTWEAFTAKCKEIYSIDIQDEHRPMWGEDDVLRRFSEKMLDGMHPCPPEFNEVFVKHLEDILA